MSTATKRNHTSSGSSVRFLPEQTFDRKRMRHSVEGETSVLHCHHYATLFTQLAMDASHFNGPALLAQAAAESSWPTLVRYFKKHKIQNTADRIAVAEQYFAFMGLGVAAFECSPKDASITMNHSHVDEGWIKKFGKRTARVNFIGEGYIKGACAAIFDLRSPNAVQVTEQQSIVCGARQSRFNASWK
jgi:hypothetical protein